MPMRVHKQSFDCEPGQFTIEVPQGAEFLTVAAQGRRFAVWFLCNPANELRERSISVVETGAPLPPDPTVYIGTVVFGAGNYVLHVFEDLE